MWIRKLLEELHFAIPQFFNARGTEPIDKDLKKELDPASVTDFTEDDADDLAPKGKAADAARLAPVPLLVDNQSAVFSVNNPETSQRTRHLDVRYFKVRDYIKQQAVRVRHISTNMNVADFFTKGLDRVLFTRYRDCLGMEDHTP